ncbi:hypothetical protein [Streptomyces tagetis]|uniref:Uncharacterized protein n=1 Tax=Streptomyces tagetis TaxID=2820809 RepID=A0A940XBX2_9ACTN|nr:hypothetical protein [Streptomyces sp. RG38]MBQ0825316.1 hypothetical protein [Streptomyces sp. RG38]
MRTLATVTRTGLATLLPATARTATGVAGRDTDTDPRARLLGGEPVPSVISPLTCLFVRPLHRLRPDEPESGPAGDAGPDGRRPAARAPRVRAA